MHAATGEEGFTGACRVLALQRSVEHGRQAAVLGLDQVVHGPAGDAVHLGNFDRLQLGRGLRAETVVQFGNDLQVAGQHAQFGGGAELQLAAFVDVERLVGTVGLHPYPRAIGGTLEQREAVADLGGAGGRQQALAVQPDLLGEGRVGKLAQVLADLALQVRLQGRGGRQVEAVQVIQWPVEHGRKPGTGDADALVGDNRHNGRLQDPVTVGHLAGQGRIGQGLVDDIVRRQHANMAVGQQRQFVAALG
ncbi:hypothetical protein D3C80_876160 [compost metagenome]